MKLNTAEGILLSLAVTVLILSHVSFAVSGGNKWKARGSRSYLGLRTSSSSSNYNSNVNNINASNSTGSSEYGVTSLCPESYGSTGKKRLVCYYRVEESFRPYDLDPCLCTHIIYSYVAVKDNFAFIAGKKGDLKFLASLKQKNPHLKVLVSIRPADRTFSFESNVTSSGSKSKAIFAKRVKDFISRHNLDGVDLDWEFFREADRTLNGREQLVTLLRGIKTVLKQSPSLTHGGYLLTLTTSKFPRDLTENYDFANLNIFVDFVNLPAFSFDSQGKTVKHPSRLHGISDMENMDSIVDLALALGLPHDQLTIGVPAHGILYKLANVSQTGPGSPAIPWNYNDAIISHTKICSIRDGSNWTMVRDKDLTAPYIYNKDKWVGFDDEISIKLKAKYVVLRNLGGVAIWSPNDDDPTGKCGYGAYPLLQTVRSVLTKSAEYINYANRTITINGKGSNGPSSYFNVIEKYGKVERVTDEDLGETPVPLPCTKQGYMKHPKDCSRFYRCVKFDETDVKSTNKFQYGCPPGLVFDEVYEICNWPSWSPSCGGSGEILQAPQRKFSCPSYGYFQDPSDCAYFYYCSDFGKGSFQPYEFKCPFDLGFDEEKLLCNWKWLVNGCKEASKPPPDTATEMNLYPDLVNGKLDSASQGLDGEPDELLEKRSDDSSVHFVDESPHHFIKSEGRKSFARSIKDAVTGALDNVKSILGMENQSQHTPKQLNAAHVSPAAQVTSPQATVTVASTVSDVTVSPASTVSPSSSKTAPQKRQDLLADPVFLAEESIISNLFAGINPFANYVDKKSNRKATGDVRGPIKVSGKEQFISIPIIEVLEDKRPNRKAPSPIPRAPLRYEEPHKQRRPIHPPQQQQQQHHHHPLRDAGHYRPSPAPLPRAPSHRPQITREPSLRATAVPGQRAKHPTPERRPERPTQAYESPELIPVPILTLKEAMQSSIRDENNKKKLGTRRPAVNTNRPRPEPEGHQVHRVRGEPEPEPRRKATRVPENGQRDSRPSHAPRDHVKPHPERHHHISAHRIVDGDQPQRYNKPAPERRPIEARKPANDYPTHAQHVASHIQHQAQPSILIDHREPAPRPNSLHPKQKRPAAPVNDRPKQRPAHPPARGDPKRRPYPPAHAASIAAQLPPEIFNHYDVDIKPLSVHPIVSPAGTNLDLDNLSLLPDNKPKDKRPYGMPGHKVSRPPLDKRPVNAPRQPVQENRTRPPARQPVRQQSPSPVPATRKRPAGPPRGQPADRHVVEKLPVQRLPVVSQVQLHHRQPSLEGLSPDQLVPVDIRHLSPQAISLTQESIEAHNKRQLEKLQAQQHAHHAAVHHQQVHPQPPTSSVPQQIHSHSHVIQHGPALPQDQATIQQLSPLHLSVASQQQATHATVSPSVPQHPSYSAQYQPHTSGSQIHQQYHVNQLSEKLAPQLNQPESPSSTVTKNGFKPISPQYYSSQSNGNYLPVSSFVNQGSHYQFSQPISYTRPTAAPVTPVTSAPLLHWTSSSSPLAGKTTKSSLLIVPVPDPTYKANTLNDVIKLAKEYPQLFPPGFDFSKVASVTRTKQEEPSPVYYDSQGHQVKNDTQHSDFIIMTIKDEETSAKDSVTSANYWTASTSRPSDKVTATPVVIKVEIPESKPEIVNSIVNQVKDTLGKVPSSTSSPVQVSVSVSSTLPVTQSSVSDATATTAQQQLNNKNIPQSLYESIQQVIAQHLYNQLGEKKEITSTTEGVSSSSSASASSPISSSSSTTASFSSSSSAFNSIGSSTVEVPTSTESIEVTTLNPTTVAEVVSSSASPHAVLEQIPYNQLYNVTEHQVNSAWPYQPWFQPPVYANPYYPHYAPPPINQTNQYFPYPSYPYAQWGSNAGNYSNAFAGWYEWAYTQQQQQALQQQQQQQQQQAPLANDASSTAATTKLPAPMIVTITTTTAAPPTTKEQYTTKSPYAFDSLRTKGAESTSAPESPQIQVYIVQGPNGPQVQTKTVNSKDGHNPNVQVYVIDENNKNKGNSYGSSSSGVKAQSSSEGQYFQYAHSHFQPEESQVKPFTTSSPLSDNLYAKEDSYRDLEYEDEESASTGSSVDQTTRPSFSQFLPSSKVQSLQNLYNQQGFPGLRNFTNGSVPESACTRPGLFQHPHDCNKFYECYFDRFVNKYTLHLFECPVKLAFDSRIVGCSGPTDPTVCVQY